MPISAPDSSVSIPLLLRIFPEGLRERVAARLSESLAERITLGTKQTDTLSLQLERRSIVRVRDTLDTG
jgi:hypothetical protein